MEAKTSVTRVYFVRHGRSEANESKAKRHIIWDAPLHKIGVRQASLLRDYFRGIPLDLCIVSPLRRAIQTALLALGAWENLEVGSTILRAVQPSADVFEAASRTAVPMEEAVVTKVATTVQVDPEDRAGKEDSNSSADGSTTASSSVRFDASDDEVEPLDEGQTSTKSTKNSRGRLGPGSRVRVRKEIRFSGGSGLEENSVGTVTNSILTTRPSRGSTERQDRCLNVVPESLWSQAQTDPPPSSSSSSSSSSSTRLPRLQAWPSVRERLVESDDLGSSSAVLQSWFPCVDFSKLPGGDEVWWYAPNDLSAAKDPVDCRACWEKEDYEEPERDFEARVTSFLTDLERTAAESQLKSVAVFAHCWTLEEIWRQRFGKAYTFNNAEVAVVEFSHQGSWRWLQEEQ